jgi:hypothetical protein
MNGQYGWTDIGAAAELAAAALRHIKVGNSAIALSYRDGTFGALSNARNQRFSPAAFRCSKILEIHPHESAKTPLN